MRSLLLALVFVLVFPSWSLAQTFTVSESCPYEMEPFVSVLSAPNEVDQSSTYQAQLEIANLSKTYQFADLSLSIGFFAAGESVPSYWVELPHTYTLGQEDRQSVEAVMDLSMLPQGTYRMVPVLGQGDWNNRLGRLLQNELVTGEGQVVIKRGAAETDLSIDLSVNDVDVSGGSVALAQAQDLLVSVMTLNSSQKPIVGAATGMVLAQNGIPHGTALLKEEYDELKLLPGKSRDTRLVQPNMTSGLYTLFITVVESGVAHALSRVPVVVGEGGIEQNHVYVKTVATKGSQATVCLDKISTLDQFQSEMPALELAVSIDEKEMQAIDLGTEERPAANTVVIDISDPAVEHRLGLSLNNPVLFQTVPETGKQLYRTSDRLDVTFVCEQPCSDEVLTAASDRDKKSEFMWGSNQMIWLTVVLVLIAVGGIVYSRISKKQEVEDLSTEAGTEEPGE